MTTRKKLLWVGDAVCPSGFARASHNILETLRQHFDIAVLGMNFRGDTPTGYPYPVWCALAGGDWLGAGRILEVCTFEQPDVILIQNDGWQFKHYVERLQLSPDFKNIPIIGAVAVDGLNFDGRWLDGLQHAIFWTDFAMKESRRGGYFGPASVVPLGVDLDIYHPMDKLDARARVFGDLGEVAPGSKLDSSFIVGWVARNGPRKRLDLAIRYFAAWKQQWKPENAYLFLHTTSNPRNGIDVQQLAAYYGILDWVILNEMPEWGGVSEAGMCERYNCFDVQLTTSQGEGFGLPVFEGMACKVPQIVPKWSALGELCDGSAWMVDCLTTMIGDPFVNVIGGIPDEGQVVSALQRHYDDMHVRVNNGQAAYERASEPRFRWASIGERYVEIVSAVADGRSVDSKVTKLKPVLSV